MHFALQMHNRLTGFVVVLAAAAASACASLPPQLGRMIQPVRFQSADDRGSDIRLLGPTADAPLGRAAVRLWMKVTNPNPFGLTLSTLRATLVLADAHAAEGDFPLGLPLEAGQESVVPLDLAIRLNDVPSLATALRRAASAQPLPYRVEGSFGVEVGRLGSPTFGPMTLFSGEVNPV